MSQSDRMSKTRLVWHTRGRADTLVILARHLGWSDTMRQAMADELNVDRADLHYAILRSQECAE